MENVPNHALNFPVIRSINIPNAAHPTIVKAKIQVIKTNCPPVKIKVK